MSDALAWNRKIIEKFQANEGKMGGPFAGTSVLLLHSAGAKTGWVCDEQARRYSGFAEYQHRTGRVIPVVELIPNG